ncbi:hypothetical protein GGS24DRAFT_509734 [Hypoxylon argillaceum]|nr:hypothetical protein GGS24DRAFT_509734 [Hypoxylon argillaceum]
MPLLERPNLAIIRVPTAAHPPQTHPTPRNKLRASYKVAEEMRPLFDADQAALLLAARQGLDTLAHEEAAASHRAALARVAALHARIAAYLPHESSAFEAFLTRVLETVHAVRASADWQARVALRIDAATGVPHLRLGLRPCAPTPHLLAQVEASTREMVWGMAEAGGAVELPFEVRVTWQLVEGADVVEMGFVWGDEEWHFGNLDLGGCLQRFPSCVFDLGWF